MTRPGKMLKRTILIADDDPAICELLSSILSKEGYKTITVQDGKAVLDRANRGHVDLVILDVVMADMSGLKVLEELKKTMPKLPVIVISGYGNLQAARDAMLFGAYDYITKPFNFDFLKAIVKHSLRKRPARI